MVDKSVMLITGTRKGIGKYLAEYYTNKEYQIIGCSRGDVDVELDNYEHFCLDVCDEKDVKKKKCSKCNAEMILRKSVYGSFYGCEKYPKCRNTEKLEQ